MDVPAAPNSTPPPRPHRLVITGASGALGRHLLEKIASWPDTRILALLRGSSRFAQGGDRAQCCRLDLRDRDALAAAVRPFRPTAIIHCAATGMQQPRPPWFELAWCNVDLSLDLCATAALVPGCHFVHVSSGLAYRDQNRPLREDDPLDSQHPYGATKAAADVLVRAAAAELRVPLTVIRPFSFSGAGDAGTRLFPSLLRAAAERRALDLSPGNQRRDHCAVADIAEGIAWSVARRDPDYTDAQIFNLGSGSQRTLRQLVEEVVQALGLEVKLNFGARAYAPFEPMHLVADISRAKTALGWQPRTSFPFAIWQLAQESFPSLTLKEPPRTL